MSKSRRVTVFGLGVNILYENFQYVSGEVAVNNVPQPLYFVGAARYDVGTTPVSLFIAVLSLDPPGQVKEAEGEGEEGEDQSILGVAGLRVTVSNTPTPFGGDASIDDDDTFTIDEPEVVVTSVGGVPDVPTGGA